MGNLYTIGHSQHRIEYFIKLLKKYNIGYVLDVRSMAYSKYAEQFNKEIIEKNYLVMKLSILLWVPILELDRSVQISIVRKDI